MTVFPERDNRGKVYLYFCPDDTTVALDDVRGIGTFGVWDTHGKDSDRNPMAELKAVRFYQRMWTKRHRDGSPVMVGKPPGYDLLRAKGESRYPGGGGFKAFLSKGAIEEGHKILINAEQLYPPHAPAMFGGEDENFRGDETKSVLTDRTMPTKPLPWATQGPSSDGTLCATTLDRSIWSESSPNGTWAKRQVSRPAS